MDSDMIRKRLQATFARLVEKQKCPQLLTRSFCMGTYIAFSPFVGMHTLMVFLFSWVLQLELTAVFAAAWLINNPWTMVPVYALGYNTGEFVLRGMCGIDSTAWNPHWVQPISEWLGSAIGSSKLSFWSFMIGGNLIGLCAAIALYPFMKRFFARLVREKQEQANTRN